MILPDAYPLIYAFRAGASQHALCRSWLVSILSGKAMFGISPLCLAALVRITTNPRVYAVPSRPHEALGFCDYLMAHPRSQVVEPGARHWSISGGFAF